MDYVDRVWLLCIGDVCHEHYLFYFSMCSCVCMQMIIFMFHGLIVTNYCFCQFTTNALCLSKAIYLLA